MPDYEWRVVIVYEGGVEFTAMTVSGIQDARSLMKDARKVHPRASDIFIERRQIPPWTRYVPLISADQPSLPL